MTTDAKGDDIERRERPDQDAADPWLLLPWHVNGTLTPDQARRVEAELQTSRAFDAERRLLERMQTEVRDTPLIEDAIEQGFQRLRSQIGSTARVSDRGDGSSGGPARNEPLGTRWWRALALTPSRVQALVGVQTAALAAALLVVVSWPNTAPDDPRYTMLANATGSEAIGPVWRVRFADGLSEAAMRSVILDADLVIVDGPSATGVYTLAAAREVDRDAVTRELERAPATALVVDVP